MFTGARGRGQPVEKPLTRSLRPQIGYQTRQFWRISGSLYGRYQLGADRFNRLEFSPKSIKNSSRIHCRLLKCLLAVMGT
jgi:hypothetical protein